MKISIRLGIAFFIVLSFFSCTTNGIRVPGEKRILMTNLSTEYYNIAEGYMEIKKYDKAAEYYQLAMRDKELSRTAFYKLARSYALAKNWEKATECYTELLRLDPENTLLKTSMAYITAMSGKVDEAILQYKKLMESSPYDENLLESYVALLINVGRGEDAEESFFILKEKFPGNKQLTSFAQQLSDIVDNFDADKKIELPPDAKEAPKTENKKS